ncbi:MAG: hypothetical protein AAF743_08225 [Planctomycetota bacterium]
MNDMQEQLTPPSSEAWDSKRRRRRRWNTGAGAFTIALLAVTGLYWVKNPPANFTATMAPTSATTATLDR